MFGFCSAGVDAEGHAPERSMSAKWCMFLIIPGVDGDGGAWGVPAP